MEQTLESCADDGRLVWWCLILVPCVMHHRTHVVLYAG